MRFICFLLALIVSISLKAQPDPVRFKEARGENAPWVFWYWFHGAVSKEGIRADLEAMKKAGIQGAYLMPIKDTLEKPIFQPQVRQLSPAWWDMVGYAMQECSRLGLQLSMHVSDGFALAGGPWNTPEHSMQKLVWTSLQLADRVTEIRLAQPETNEGYYKDIEVLAFPSLPGGGETSIGKAHVTTNTNDSSYFLNDTTEDRNFATSNECWIQYEFATSFTTRSLEIRSRNNYQVNRLIVQTSNDGINFREHCRLNPPRHGWQDWDEPYTHQISEVSARFYRFVFSKDGTEPGAEDLDAAKWKPSIKLSALILHSQSFINQYQSKNGSVWRVSERSSAMPCIPASGIINLTSLMDADGRLNWQKPAGNWTIIRIGHTSTGHQNETAGGGKGLECDKFDPAAVQNQFDNWFGAIYDRFPQMRKVLTGFHVDSWECGSQNWSLVFREFFQKKRGYDPLPWLPAVAGYPIGSVNASEGFLYDMRLTIAELINENFYGTLKELVAARGLEFTAESVAPTMVSDGMLHYKNVDVPMGEFWLRSPTHDKPNDMLDAISAGHIYGKNIIRSESFTELRMDWDENPALLKPLLDRNLSLGINSISYHVFMHNPWLDRKPGITLDPIGLFFQRDQTWWGMARGLIDYTTRCSMLLSQGRPVVDLAVFTGDELPRRSVLPERLLSILPGTVPRGVLEKEERRLANSGQPMKPLPAGVSGSANIADPANYLDMMQGFQYDSFNPDAFNEVVAVRDGKIFLKGGAVYSALIVPGVSLLNPSAVMSLSTIRSIMDLAHAGATILWEEKPRISPGLELDDRLQELCRRQLDSIFRDDSRTVRIIPTGRGRVITGLHGIKNLAELLRLQPDVQELVHPVDSVSGMAWAHRRGEDFDTYFISNQRGRASDFILKFRDPGGEVSIWDPVSGRVKPAVISPDGNLVLRLEKDASVFCVYTSGIAVNGLPFNGSAKPALVADLSGNWNIRFDSVSLSDRELFDWRSDSTLKYFSGTAHYSRSFTLSSLPRNDIMLRLDDLHDVAHVRLNGKDVGDIWALPYELLLNDYLKEGENLLEIDVANTWHNALIGEERFKFGKLWTLAPYRLAGRALLPAGILQASIVAY